MLTKLCALLAEVSDVYDDINVSLMCCVMILCHSVPHQALNLYYWMPSWKLYFKFTYIYGSKENKNHTSSPFVCFDAPT